MWLYGTERCAQMTVHGCPLQAIIDWCIFQPLFYFLGPSEATSCSKAWNVFNGSFFPGSSYMHGFWCKTISRLLPLLSVLALNSTFQVWHQFVVSRDKITELIVLLFDSLMIMAPTFITLFSHYVLYYSQFAETIENFSARSASNWNQLLAPKI